MLSGLRARHDVLCVCACVCVCVPDLMFSGPTCFCLVRPDVPWSAMLCLGPALVRLCNRQQLESVARLGHVRATHGTPHHQRHYELRQVCVYERGLRGSRHQLRDRGHVRANLPCQHKHAPHARIQLPLVTFNLQISLHPSTVQPTSVASQADFTWAHQ